LSGFYVKTNNLETLLKSCTRIEKKQKKEYKINNSGEDVEEKSLIQNLPRQFDGFVMYFWSRI